MDGSYNPRATSDYGNPYLFTGRRVDILDANSLRIQYNRNRYYDQYTGRWLTHDPMEYEDSMSLYEYVGSDPIHYVDPEGRLQSGLLPILPPILLPGPQPPYDPIPFPPESGWDPIPDPVDVYPPYELWYVPQLSPEGTFDCCDNGRKAIEIANIAMQNGDCHDWFYDRRFETTHAVYNVPVRSNIFSFCIIGAYAYTAPAVNRIALCERSCCEPPEDTAYILIHEVGHHYCPLTFGREACASSAMEACGDALAAAEAIVGK